MRKAVFTVRELAEEIGVCRATVYNLINEDKIRAHKLGKRTVFKAENVQKLIDSLPEAA